MTFNLNMRRKSKYPAVRADHINSLKNISTRAKAKSKYEKFPSIKMYQSLSEGQKILKRKNSAEQQYLI